MKLNLETLTTHAATAIGIHLELLDYAIVIKNPVDNNMNHDWSIPYIALFRPDIRTITIVYHHYYTAR